ncbi:MAG: HD domain-containing protein [Candidatus Latescibacteria bacterium]|nr:HD domain-containing protein [Candidatus Latescibacterota bacterium]
MRQCGMSQLTEDMVLGKSIYGKDGNLLLGAGFRLNQASIRRLKTLGYPSVYIMEEGTEEVIPEDIISDQIRMQTAANVSKAVEDVKRTTGISGLGRGDIRKILEDENRLKRVVISPNLKACVSNIIEDLIASNGTLLTTAFMKTRGNFATQHALDVAILSIILGRKYHCNKDDLMAIGLGALLHDFGKIAVPGYLQEDEQKPTPEEQELLREHPTFGYLMLSKISGISLLEAHIAYQHHEHQDGEGFPRGLTGDNTPPIEAVSRTSNILRHAEIVAVANAYDNLTSDTPTSEALSAETAMKRLIQDAGSKLNKDIVAMANRVIPVFPVGATVKVVDCRDRSRIGCLGVVATVREESLNAPEVILLFDRFGRRIPSQRIDISEENTLRIELVL